MWSVEGVIGSDKEDRKKVVMTIVDSDNVSQISFGFICIYIFMSLALHP